MAKEKAEKETANKGKGVDRAETADFPIPRMQAKIDAAPKTPHHLKPALAVFTPLAIRSPLVMRRRNSSPCPNITEEDDNSKTEDDGVDFSHAHNMCQCEPAFKLTEAKCLLFHRSLGFPDDADTEKSFD